MKHCLHLFTVSFIIVCTPAFSETCQEKLGSDAGSAYRFSHALPIGNGITECYVIAKDGKGQPIKDTVVFEDNEAEKNTLPSNDTDNKKMEPTNQEELCEEKYKDMEECFESESKGMSLKSYSEARKELVNKHKGKKIVPKEGEGGSDAEKCETKGKHWNFYSKKEYLGSILCCECCQNSKTGPVIENRCKVSGN